ncbi:MAG: CAP domain-containing protein [Candidatus Giovannonibacteria bacterium]|nr:CAP domain-containing protein [Candidatus Giovannonibacteria bacterium]
MNKQFLALLLFLVLGAYLIYGIFFGNALQAVPVYAPNKIAEPAKSPLKKEIAAPPPLKAQKEAPTAEIILTADGVLSRTNKEREKAGLPELAPDQKLTASALAKVRDMFKNQYFAHESLAGKGAGDLAEKEGYEFIIIGENLALGNFEGDKALVDAWMASPGHCANILGARYKEIGIAAGRGMFEGRETWLAVQHFALPLSACPGPDENLKIGIESFEAQINNLSIQASALKAELESEKPQNRNEYEAYNAKVDDYNAMAQQMNSLIDQVKNIIPVYNQQVKIFNQCAGAN